MHENISFVLCRYTNFQKLTQTDLKNHPFLYVLMKGCNALSKNQITGGRIYDDKKDKTGTYRSNRCNA